MKNPHGKEVPYLLLSGNEVEVAAAFSMSMSHALSGPLPCPGSALEGLSTGPASRTVKKVVRTLWVSPGHFPRQFPCHCDLVEEALEQATTQFVHRSLAALLKHGSASVLL